MSLLNAVSSCWALLLGVSLIMLGNGLQGTLLGVRATLEGFPTTATGLVMTSYFVGFLLGSTLVPRFVRNVGHIRVFAALASTASAAVLAHPIFVDASAWMVLRVVTGFCYAGLYVVVESWLNDAATNETRGQLLSVYMVVAGASMGLGQLLLNTASPESYVLFVLISVLVSLSLVPISLSVSRAPSFHEPSTVSIKELYATSPLGVVGACGVGLAHGAMFGMGAVFARQIGLALDEISIFMAMALLGGLLTQWPIGWLSDTFDRRKVITGITLVAAASAAAVAIGHNGGIYWLYGLVCLFGGATVPMYSLCLAHTNDFLSRPQIVAASSTMVMVAGVGLAAGPMLVAWSMSVTGPYALFWWLALVHGAVGVFALYRMTVRDAVPLSEQRIYAPVSVRGSPVGAALASRSAQDQSELTNP